MRARVQKKIEQHLYKNGFTTATVRHIVSSQILTALVALTLGTALLWLSVWPFFFGVGAVIAAHNIWWLARSVERSMRQEYTRALAVANFLAFLARFAVVGVALFICIVWLKAPVVPLLAGLTTLVAGLTVRGFSRLGEQTNKEAQHGR